VSAMMSWRERFGVKLRPAAAGVAQVLGELESDVMAVLWSSHRHLPVREVRDHLAANGRDLAYNTVMTVLVRLSEKGLAERSKHDDMWHYRPTLPEAEFRAHLSGEVLRGLLDVAPEATLAQLVDVLAEDEPEALDELARLIEARRALSEAGGMGA
jgi:predicted transcriptional regulator